VASARWRPGTRHHVPGPGSAGSGVTLAWPCALRAGEYPAMAGHDGLRRRGRRCAARQSAPSLPAWPLRR